MKFLWEGTLIFTFFVSASAGVDYYGPKNDFILHLETILEAKFNFEAILNLTLHPRAPQGD